MRIIVVLSGSGVPSFVAELCREHDVAVVVDGEEAREELGLSFVGRGFDVQLAVPFGHPIAEGLRKVAARCIEACPTGALAARDDSQNP